MEEENILLNLQSFTLKLVHHNAITTADVLLLDRFDAHIRAEDIEVINEEIIQIFRVIAAEKADQFLKIFTFIASNVTRVKTLIRISAQFKAYLRKEWLNCNSQEKKQLFEFLISSMQRTIEKDCDEYILSHLNEAYVFVIQQQQKTVLKQFMNHMGATSINTFLNQLTILRKLLEEGLNKIEQKLPLYDVNRFKSSIKQGMQSVVKVLCKYLNNQGKDRLLVVFKSLETIPLVIENISVQDLFNSSLIEQLISLIGRQEVKIPLRCCFQAFFKFNKITSLYIKTSTEKYLQIIEAQLVQFEKDNWIDQHTDKKIAQTHIIGLLEIFLTRNAPIMIESWKKPEQKMSLQVKHKLGISKSVFNAFQSKSDIFWIFLKRTIKDFAQKTSNTFNEIDQNEAKRKLLSCLRIYLIMNSKLRLKISAEEFMLSIRICILPFTPINSEFIDVYLQTGSLEKKRDTITRERQSEENLQKEYKNLLQTIFSDRNIRELYVKFISQKISTVGETIEMCPDLQKANLLNKICWAFLSAYQCESSAFRTISVIHTSQTLTKLAAQNNDDKVRHCCKVNSLNILWASSTNDSTYPEIMKIIQSSDHIDALILLKVLTKVISEVRMSDMITFSDLDLIIKKINRVEQLNIDRYEWILKLYPVILRVLGDISHIDSEKTQKILNSIAPIRENEAPELQCSTYALKIAQTINTWIIQSGKRKPLPQIIKLWAFNHSKDVIDSLEDTKLNLNISLTQQQDFCLIENRREKIIALKSMISLAQTRYLEEKDQALRRERDYSYFVQHFLTLEFDFIHQSEIRIKEYLHLSIEFYRWVIKVHGKSCEKFINNSILRIVESLRVWDKKLEFQRQTNHFWKEVTKLFFLSLSKDNTHNLVRLYDECQKTIENVSSIVQVYQELLLVMNQRFKKKPQTFNFGEFLTLFKKSFEILFCSLMKNQVLFERLSKLFFNLIDFLICLQTSLDPSLKMENEKIAFNTIYSSICQRFPLLRGNEQHETLLAMLFKQATCDRWLVCIREYVGFIMKLWESEDKKKEEEGRKQSL